METVAFRRLIEETYRPDPQRHCDALDLRLAELPAESLEGFHDTLHGLLDWLDLPELQTAAALAELRLDDSSFRAFCCRLILAPRQVWQAGVTNPDNLLPLTETGSWTCERLLVLASDRHEALTGRRLLSPPPSSRFDVTGVPLEDFAERFPAFFRRYPWGSSLHGIVRERGCIYSWDARVTAVPIKRYLLLGVAASTLLLITGHPWGAAGLFSGVVTALFLRSLRAFDRRASAFVQHRQRHGHLTGTVPFRVLHLTAEAAEVSTTATGPLPFQLHDEITAEAADKAQWRVRLDQGLRWLTHEASRFACGVEFREVAPAAHRRVPASASLKSAYCDAEAHVEQIRQQMLDDGHHGIVIVVSDVGTLGFANPLDRAMCVASLEPAGIYAHELLHLYGAMDLYDSDRLDQLYPQAMRRWVETRFEKDFLVDEVSIMDDVCNEEARVDRFTARLVGWVDESRT
ncbi:MAG: DUF4240 domain-containing protein [Nannocystales bacterium]